MQSKNNKPTAKQKAWRELVRSHGCMNCPGRAAEIHHVVGAAGRQDKVKIGHWFVLPLCSECHRTHPEHNVTSWRNRYTEKFGSQWMQFIRLCKWVIDQDTDLPFGVAVTNAIGQTRK